MSMAKRKDPYLSGLLQKLAETDKKISFTRLRSEDLDGESREAIYEFIEKYSGRFGVRWLLNEFGLSPSVYYNYLHSKRDGGKAQKDQILDEIRSIYEEHNGTDGYRKMHYYLLQRGYNISLETTRKYMNQELGLCSVVGARHPPYEKRMPFHICPDILKGNFKAGRVNEKWSIDFTFIALENGSVRFNCAIMDLYDRSIVASLCGTEMTSKLAIKTLKKALSTDKEIDPRRLILHSDQGNEFTSEEFTTYCLERGIRQSMSPPGHPYSNAPMERYFSTLKSELINRKSYGNERELYDAVDDFVENYYNTTRPHTYNNNKPPYEVRYKQDRPLT